MRKLNVRKLVTNYMFQQMLQEAYEEFVRQTGGCSDNAAVSLTVQFTCPNGTGVSSNKFELGRYLDSRCVTPEEERPETD